MSLKIKNFLKVVSFSVIFSFFLLVLIEVFVSIFMNLSGYSEKISIITGTLVDEKSPEPESYQNTKWFKEYSKEASYVFNNIQWRAYTYWQSKPFKGKYINIDQNSIRKTWHAEDAKEDYINVLVFGGSTVWGWGARDYHTIPSYIAKNLKNKHNINAKVINFGELGYITTQELIIFLNFLKDNAFNKNKQKTIVIFYDGLNDVYGSFQSGCAGIPQNEFLLSKEFNSTLCEKFIYYLLSKSSVYKLSQYLFLKKKISEKYNNDQLKDLSDKIIDTYIFNIKCIQSITNMFGLDVLFYWQPVIFTKKYLTKYEESLEKIHDYSRNLFYIVNKDIDTKTQGINNFYNINNILDSDKSFYIDPWHINEEGNKIIGHRIAEDILELVKNGGILGFAASVE